MKAGGDDGGGFEGKVRELTGDELRGVDIETLQVNVGLECNQQCCHCHLSCGPDRTEVMTWPVMEMVLDAVKAVDCRLVDITGGAPELNPDLRRFIAALREGGREVQVRTNLTVLLEPGYESFGEFFRDHQVKLVASMPCYLEENVRAQRGSGVYESSIEAIRRLNALGYGVEGGLQLDLVYNPGGPSLPPEQGALEADYKRELGERFGVSFTRLLTIANMPIGRYLEKLRAQKKEEEYRRLLEESFNPDTLGGLMCRHQISVAWDGTLYDCDFNFALGCPVDHGAPDHLRDFSAGALERRQIVAGRHCFGCTAGMGSSCGGALA